VKNRILCASFFSTFKGFQYKFLPMQKKKNQNHMVSWRPRPHQQQLCRTEQRAQCCTYSAPSSWKSEWLSPSASCRKTLSALISWSIILLLPKQGVSFRRFDQVWRCEPRLTKGDVTTPEPSATRWLSSATQFSPLWRAERRGRVKVAWAGFSCLLAGAGLRSSSVGLANGRWLLTLWCTCSSDTEYLL